MSRTWKRLSHLTPNSAWLNSWRSFTRGAGDLAFLAVQGRRPQALELLVQLLQARLLGVPMVEGDLLLLVGDAELVGGLRGLLPCISDL